MTTQDFIYKHIGNTSNFKVCSSVFVENGVIYSYGYHYPLATIINGYGFVNNGGYSSTTAKHILWAAGALRNRLGSDNVFMVDLEGARSFEPEQMAIKTSVQLVDLIDEMSKKKRTDTQVYKHLEYERDRKIATLTAVKVLV